jgi:hypothetical protein
MLSARAADAGDVMRRALAVCSFACCGLVIASFTMFALDQVGGASRHQVAEIAGGSPARTGTSTVTSPDPGQPRRSRPLVAGARLEPVSQ